MALDLDQIQKLIKMLEESQLKKLSLKQGDFELTLDKEGELPPASMMAPMHMLPAHHHHHSLRGSVDEPSSEVSHKGSGGQKAEGKHVTSPMVGTFYASSAPDQPAFVKVGDRVDAGTVVCIIEAMKVMNEVKAGISGVVAEILVDNAQPIEFGTKLIRVV